MFPNPSLSLPFFPPAAWQVQQVDKITEMPVQEYQTSTKKYGIGLRKSEVQLNKFVNVLHVDGYCNILQEGKVSCSFRNESG